MRNTDYRRAADDAMDALRRLFWDARARRFRPAAPGDPKALPWDFMWANGVAFSALVGGVGADPARYRPWMDGFFDGLEGYWDADATIPGYDAYLASPDGDDKYYDDNAWMVLTFCEAYARTAAPRYLQRAASAHRFVLSGWDERLGGGICWRQDRTSKNTCSNAPAAVGALALARFLNPGYHVPWARRIVAWTVQNLQAPDGTFWDNVAIAGGQIQKTKWTYNTALMLRAHLDLYRHTGEQHFLAEARRIAQASEKEFVEPRTGVFRDDALFSHLLAEAYLDLYAETREAYLRDRVRTCADYCLNSLRDPSDGGFWTSWKPGAPRETRKSLIAHASTARLLWLFQAGAAPKAWR